MDEDNPITRALAEAAVERLIEQVRRDRDFFQRYADNAREVLAGYTEKVFQARADEADATLRAVLGEEGGG